MHKNWTRALPLLMGLTLAGCATLLPPAPIGGSIVRSQGATLRLMPTVSTGARIQAEINPLGPWNIKRLEVIPTLKDATGSFVPVSATTGQPTTWEDPGHLKLNQSGDGLSLNSQIALSNLRPHTTYRILARAYDAQDQQISVDASSMTPEVETGENDRPTFEPLPIQLKNVLFSGSISYYLSAQGYVGSYDQATMTLWKVAGGIESLVPNALPMVVPMASFSTNVKIAGLQANTNYRLKFEFRKKSGGVYTPPYPIDIYVRNDDEVASSTGNNWLSFSLPN
ncbi:hypothetical protein J7643_17110 [bacterium]|nr:hypothetical protein [bacterium]